MGILGVKTHRQPLKLTTDKTLRQILISKKGWDRLCTDMHLIRRPMTKEIGKQGQTCIYEGKWGTLKFLLPNGKALISLDGQAQEGITLPKALER